MPNLEKVELEPKSINLNMPIKLNLNYKLPEGLSLNQKAPSIVTLKVNDEEIHSEKLQSEHTALLIPNEELSKFQNMDSLEVKLLSTIFYCKKEESSTASGQCKIKSIEAIMPVKVTRAVSDNSLEVNFLVN